MLNIIVKICIQSLFDNDPLSKSLTKKFIKNDLKDKPTLNRMNCSSCTMSFYSTSNHGFCNTSLRSLTIPCFVLGLLCLGMLLMSQVGADPGDPTIIDIAASPGATDELQTVVVHVDGVTSSIDLGLNVQEQELVIFEDTQEVKPADGAEQFVSFYWTPMLPGDYSLSSTISFAEDTNLSNNELELAIPIRDMVPSTAAAMANWDSYEYDERTDNGDWWQVVEDTISQDEGWRFFMYGEGEERYGDEADVGLVSQPVHLPATLGSAEIWFYQKADLGSGDVGSLQLSEDPDFSPFDTNWKTLYSTPSQPISDWTLQRVILDPWIGSTIRLQFRFTSDGSVNSQGWWLDGFQFAGQYTRHDLSITLVDGPDHVLPGSSKIIELELFNAGITEQDLEHDLTLFYSVLHRDLELGSPEPNSYISIKGDLLPSLTSTQVLFELLAPTEPGAYLIFINASLAGEQRPADNLIERPLLVGKTLELLDHDVGWMEISPGIIAPEPSSIAPYQLGSTNLANPNDHLALTWIQDEPVVPRPWIGIGTMTYDLPFETRSYLKPGLGTLYLYEATLPSEMTRQGEFQAGIQWQEPVRVRQPEIIMFGKAGSTIDIASSSMALVAGHSIDIEVNVANQGLGSAELHLSLEGLLEGWSHSYNRNVIHAQPLSTNIVFLTVTAPANTQGQTVVGTFEASIVVNSITPPTRAEQKLFLEVPEPQITIQAWTADRNSLLEDQMAHLSLEIANSGSLLNVMDVALYHHTESGAILLDSRQITDLGNDQQQQIDFEFDSATAHPGLNSLQVVIISAQLEQDLQSSVLSLHVIKNDAIDEPVEEGTENPITPTVVVGVTILSSIGLLGVGLFKQETLRFTLTKGLLPLWAPLYTRLRQDAMLDNQVRDDLYQYINTNPGTNYSTIMRELKLKNGLFAYHLATLERENYITSQHDGIYRRFYPSNKVPGFSPNLLADRIDSEMKAIIVRLVQKEPGLSQTQIAKQMGESRQRINYHVNKLVEDRVLNLKRNGRASSLYLNPIFSKGMDQ